MRAIQSTVCQCGHEQALHIELGCCSCACGKFVLPASNDCQVCGATFETGAQLEAHRKAYRERIFHDL